MQQMTINLQQGLLEQFPDWMDCVRASVYDCGKPFKAIAAELDYSPSELSRRLSKAGDIPALLADLPRIIRATKDHRPIYWLIEHFMLDDATKEARMMERIDKILPELESVVSYYKRKRRG